MIKNLVQLLKERRMIKDKGLIFINEDGIEKNISYNDIFEIASKILYNLQFYGVKERDEVVFQIDDNEDYLCMFWACILGNIVPVPLPVKSNLEYKNRVYKIINMLNSPYLLADQEVLNQMKNDGDNIINKKVLDIINNKSFSTKDIKKLTGVGEISEGNDDDIAFIQFSSGSTGDPKGVMVTNKNIVCNITSLNRRTKTTDDDIIFSWLPLTHSMGLSMVHIAAYVQGINQYIMKPSTFIKKPLLWMQKVSEHKVTQLYSANFAYKYLIDAVKDQSNLKWDLSNVRYMMNASEIISSITCKEFGEVMKKYGLRDNVIHPGYGLSEATVAVTVEDAEKAFSSINIDRNNLLVGDKVQEVNEDDESCITLVDVGYPIDCCEIRICDSENNVLEENHIGHIQLKGESITKGYYNNLEATNSVYLENGWMDTGDLGFLRNKRLVVTGRFKDLIIINGVNYYPYDLERVAEDALDIGSGKIVSCGIFNKELQTDEAIMFVEYDKDIDGFIDIARNIKQHISKVMGLEINKIYPIDKIPKTVSGKVQRFILVNRYINEEFNDIKIEIDKAVLKKNIQYKSIELSKDNKIQPIIIDSILKISKEIIGEENIELSHCISAYAPSSIKIMQLTSRIENKHGVEISFKEFIEQETIFDIVNLVINKLNQKKENNEKNIYSQVKADTENKHEEFNLTDVQMAYLAGRDIKFELGGRSTHFYVEMDSELDIERFNLSFQKVINHHPMLRAIILESGQQKILENVPEYKIEVIDVTSKDQNKRELQFKQIRDEMSHHVFKTDKWPLFDIRAIKVGEYNYKVCMGFDMLIIDGSSFEILGKDLRKYYDDPEFQLEDVDFTFRDYISGYEKMKQTSRYENDRKYWLEKLKDFAVAPRLPLKVNPMNVKYPYYKRKCLVISKEIWNKIKKKADDKKIRHSALLCSIYAWVLSYWSNQERMAINMTLFNRYPFHESINELIGDFTSVMLVDVNVNKDNSIWENTINVQNEILNNLEHKCFDGVEVIREYAKINSLGLKAAMPIVFTSMLFNDDESGWTRFGEMNEGVSQTSQVHLDYQALDIDGNLTIRWDYAQDIFEEKVIDSMFNHYVKALYKIAEGKENIKLELDKDELTSIKKYNETDVEIEENTLQELFKKQVQITPDSIAVKLEDKTITYKELDKKSNQIANYLIDKNIGCNDFVAIYAKRDINTIINIMAVLKTGAAYVPIEPEYPDERREYIYSNSNCKMLLEPSFYNDNNIEKYSEICNGIYDNKDDVAYVIYTSGSTGKPKGVVITHKSAVNTIVDINNKFNVTSNDKIIGLSSMGFDLSVYDIFGALTSGATLVMVKNHRDVMKLINIIKKEKITLWNSVPAIIDMVMSNSSEEFIDYDLKNVLLSGDWIPMNLPEKIKKHFKNVNVISLGGATEASIWSIYYPVKEVKEEWKSIPYGYPLGNQKFYVLDHRMEVCPVGVEGELYIGGQGVAKGYMNDEEKTKNAFINHPKLGYIYKTGDYGKLHEAGYIEFLGRKDCQVKIRGYRIELGEIEKQILEFKNIKNAVVVDNADDKGNKYIAAYVISDSKIEIDSLKEFLSQTLPNYMIPKGIIEIDEIPLTSNGKVNKRLLPEIDFENQENSTCVSPRNNVEEDMVNIWNEVFGKDNIGVFDNFFSIGGDSIKAIQISAKAKQKSINISLTDIYEYMNIATLIENANISKEILKVSQQEVTGEVKITPIQQWFFDLNSKYPDYWNFTKIFKVSRELNLNLLEETFKKIIQHHDILRTSFKIEENKIVQYIRPFSEISFKVESVDLSIYESDKRIELLKEYGENIQNTFSLKDGVIIKAIVFNMGKDGQYLMIPVHHLVMDGISWRIITEDIESLYISKNRKELPLKTTSYKEWSEKLSYYAANSEIDVKYWEEINIKDKSNNVENTFKNFKIHNITLNEKETNILLKRTNNSQNNAIKDIMISSMLMAITESMNKDDALITIEDHGREDLIKNVDISRTVGWFTCEYPIYLKKQSSIYNTIEHVKETLENIPGKGLNFGISKFLKNNKKLYNIAPEFGFNYLGQFDYDTLNKDSLLIESNVDSGAIIHSENNYSHGLYVYGITINGSSKFEILYNSNKYTESEIAKFSSSLKEKLLAVGRYYNEEVFEEEYSEYNLYKKYESDVENLYKPFDLTDVQMAYLMGRNEHFTLGGISTHYYGEFDINQDIETFNKNIRKLIKRHPMLRTVISPDGQQITLDNVPDYKIEVKDLRGIDSALQAKYIANERERMSHHIFKSDQWPLFEFKGYKLDDDKNYIFMGIDLMIADGGSFKIFGDELRQLSENSDLELEELKFTFRDYINALSEFKASPIYLEDKRFWKDKLREFPLAPMIPLKKDPNLVKKPYFKRKKSVINKNDWDLLKKKARENNVTPSALLCTAYSEILAHWSNQPDMAINLTVFNRHPFHEDVEKLVGDFTSIILLDIHLDAKLQLWDNAKKVQSTLMKGLEHRHYDGVEFIRDISRDRGLENVAAMPIVFTSMLFDEKETGLSEIFAKMKYGISQTSQVYIDYQVMENNGNLCITWDYVEEIFDSNVIDSMFSQYIKCLYNILEEQEILKFNNSENYGLLQEYNDTGVEIEENTLQELFKKQVQITPDSIAVKLEDKTITYKELDKKSNQIANYLIDKNIGCNDFVAIYAKRDINTIINIMAVLKTGAAYVPIEPEYPDERREYIYSNSNCKMLLEPSFYNDNNIEKYSEICNGIYDNKDDVAYVIYTSGSTGKPKGVVITHKSAVNTIVDINNKFNVTSNDKIIGLSSMGFDLSVYDIFGALTSGATLVMVKNHRDVMKLINIIKKEKITLWNSVPAIIDMVMSNSSEEFIDYDLKNVLLSGDWIPMNLPEKIKKHFKNVNVISLGGATEASIWSIYYPVKEVKEEWKSIPYGYPLGNQKFYVLDYRMEICPVGVEGQLYIGGKGIAKGYMNDEEKTRNAFINHSKLGYIYKTGDYGKLHESGYIEFLGRKDHQVKIRGYRIELGEIEKQIFEYGDIKNAVVVDRTDKNGNKYICAYLVADEEIDISKLRNHLYKVLPEYMIPNNFIQLEKILLTANGKVDLKALPEPVVMDETAVDIVKPVNEIQESMIKVWQEVFSSDCISITDRFFALGGDSIKAIQICAKLQKHGIKLEVHDILVNQSIDKISEHAKNIIRKFEQGLISGTSEFTPIQKWFFEHKFENSEHWNQAFNLYKRDGFNEELLRKVLDKLVEHHDSLRSIFDLKDGKQIYNDLSGNLYRFESFDLTDINEYEKIIDNKTNDLQKMLNIENGPLMSVGNFKTINGDYLVLIVHHLIVDGVSWRIIFEDLAVGYKQAELKKEIKFDEKMYSFKQWSEDIYEYVNSDNLLSELDYWIDIESKSNNRLPKTRDSEGNKVKDSKTAIVRFSKDETENILCNINKGYNTEINEILLTALVISLKKWTNNSAININIEGHGRENIIDGMNLNRIIGWFTSIYPVVINIEDENDILKCIRNVKESMRGIPNKGVGYGLLRYLRDENSLKQLGDINNEITFNYLGQMEQESIGDVFEVIPDFVENCMSLESERPSLIDFVGIKINGELTFRVIYNTKIFDEEVINNLLFTFKEQLLKIVSYFDNVNEHEIITNDFESVDISDEEFNDILDILCE